MRGHINEQIITQNGKPVFVVVPYDAYQKLKKQKTIEWWGDGTPHRVVGAIEIEGINPMKAWRKFLKLTQVEVSDRAGMQQSAYARLENSNKQPKQSTILKVANAMNLTLEQLGYE